MPLLDIQHLSVRYEPKRQPPLTAVAGRDVLDRATVSSSA